MAKKTVDLAAKKQAKQKKIAIVGFVLFLAVMAFSVPKTLKMLKGPQPIAQPTQTAPTPTPTPTPAGTPPAGTADPTAAPTVAGEAGTTAVLVDTGAAPVPAAGQLVSFERFASKDPFSQQVSARPQAPAVEPTVEPDAAAPTPVLPPAPAGAGGSPAPGTSAEPSPTTPTTTPTRPTSAVISVNGVRATISVGATFPEDEPLFELVAATAKTVKIGIAGGSLTGGAATVTLEQGKKVTLMNTADGTQYELVLVSLA